MKTKELITVLLLLLVVNNVFSQTCSSTGDFDEFLANRINGNVDFTVIGKSQNPLENNSIEQNTCESFFPSLNTSDNLVLPPNRGIVKAMLVWSGMGDPIRTVSLNSLPINSSRCFTQTREGLNYFSAYADVTDFVQSTGEANYTFSGLDNSQYYLQYRCGNGPQRSTVYGGWALIVVYETVEDEDFTIFYYDGFRLFRNESFDVVATANVYDKYEGSHVGVISWEGDKDSRIVGDDISLNGQRLDNGIDVANNLFNGTNTFANPPRQNFFNGDIDDFDATEVVSSRLNTEEVEFRFRLTSGQDLILLNNIILRIPNEAPDALIAIPDNFNLGCSGNRTITFSFTYENGADASNILPRNTPVNFYFNTTNGEQIGSTVTQEDLEPGEVATATATIQIPEDYIGTFTIIAYIDDPSSTAKSFGTVLELREDNNIFSQSGFIDQSYSNLSLTENICDGESFTLGEQIITESGNYPFSLKTKLGQCDSTGVLNLIVRDVYNDPPISSSICIGDRFLLPDGSELSPAPRNEPYTYTTTLTSQYGCDSTITTILQVYNKKFTTLEPTICIGQPYVLPKGDTVYTANNYVDTLFGATIEGCDSIVNTRLQVIDVIYPNAFAPNKNNKNEGFKALLPTNCPIEVSNYNLQIFDRWGQKVFETTDITEAWNGENKKQITQTNYYLWKASYDLANGERINQSGGVTLVQ